MGIRALEEAQRALDARYRARGYNRVTIDYQARTVETEAASRVDVDVVVRVDEGPQQRLREVVTSGVSRTRPGIVSRALWMSARRSISPPGTLRGGARTKPARSVESTSSAR
jgi:outer membrane protein assembly factor BamA